MSSLKKNSFLTGYDFRWKFHADWRKFKLWAIFQNIRRENLIIQMLGLFCAIAQRARGDQKTKFM
jgi:hypothetical protein